MARWCWIRSAGQRSHRRCCLAHGRPRDTQPSAWRSVLMHGREFGAQIELVEARCVITEDRTLDCTVCRSEGGETMLLLHVLWDLEPAKRFDLPLGRAVPHRVRAPKHVIMPQALDQGA